MKIRAITLDGEELPATIAVVMTRDEAALIARLTGALAPATVNAALGYDIGDRRWPSALREINAALNGVIFNRYWDDGVDDVIPVWPEFNDRLKP